MPARPERETSVERSAGAVNPQVRPRPRWLRALGTHDPPPEITVDDCLLRRVRVLKHDSWAATALYASRSHRTVCKFNRQQPLFILPMKWLGHWLARREAAMLSRLEEIPNIPRVCGAVHHRGRRLRHAVAHEYVPGHPLGEHESVNDAFFARLRGLLAEMHQRDVAYVDLHKRENIIVGNDGEPYLVDFQISLGAPVRWRVFRRAMRPLLRLLQQSDRYHFEKHFARCRPDQAGRMSWDVGENPPWWIWWHRKLANPLRAVRRRMLTRLRVRSGRGHSESEYFPEDGHMAVKTEPPVFAASAGLDLTGEVSDNLSRKAA